MPIESATWVGRAAGSLSAPAVRACNVARVLRSVLFFLALSFVPQSSTAADAERARSIFLIASRDLNDPNFHETVVLVTQAASTPMGVIINRASRLPLSKLFPEAERLDDKSDRVFVGGPVARQALLFLFRAGSPPEGAVEVMEGVYLSGSANLLRELLKRDKPTQGLRVFAGHSGWAPGQLEAEIVLGGWHLAPADADTLFDKPPESIWSELIKRAGGRTVTAPSDLRAAGLIEFD